MNWYLAALRKYADFDGRSRRKEYWHFVLYSLFITVVLTLADRALGLHAAEAGIGVLYGLYGLAVFVPSLAVAVRRLHDTDRSGWWLLISLIPILGAIILLFFLIEDSKPGENQYGSNPKQVAF